MRFTEVADDVAPTGNLVGDAHIAALTVENGARTFWMRDRDYRKFAGIRVRERLTPFGRRVPDGHGLVFAHHRPVDR